MGEVGDVCTQGGVCCQRVTGNNPECKKPPCWDSNPEPGGICPGIVRSCRAKDDEEDNFCIDTQFKAFKSKGLVIGATEQDELNACEKWGGEGPFMAAKFGPVQEKTFCSGNWFVDYPAAKTLETLEACKEECGNTPWCKAITFGVRGYKGKCVLCHGSTTASNAAYDTYVLLRKAVTSSTLINKDSIIGYSKKGTNGLCDGGELTTNDGPDWEKDKGIEACKDLCDDSVDCKGLVWYETFGCRTYNNCESIVRKPGGQLASFINLSNRYIFFHAASCCCSHRSSLLSCVNPHVCVCVWPLQA